jgi:hypothetical protein
MRAFDRDRFVMDKVHEICQNICERGSKTVFPEIAEWLFMKIDEELEKYLPEPDYDV